jgi:hypothetical protein
MKFSTRQDIEASADFVFQQLTDFDGFERQAMRRGAQVQRKAPSQPIAVGSSWELSLPFRGKQRDVHAQIVTLDAPNQLNGLGLSGGLSMSVDIELVPLSAQRTRVTYGLDVTPKNLSSRILVQSMKFAKTALQRRFERRLSNFTDLINDRYEAQKAN